MAEITEQIAASGDDGHTYSTTLVANVNYAFVGYDGSYTYNQFFRFGAVSIPAGVTILSAKLQIKSYGNYSAGACNANIYFEAADNPAAPTTKAQYDGRALTDAVAWSSIGSWSTDQWYDSPDLTSILQAVIDRGGWAEDQAVIAYVKNNSSSSGAYRGAKTRDAGAEEGAKLVVVYGIGGTSADGSKFGETVAVIMTAEKSLADSGSVADTVDGQSLTDSIADQAAVGDTIDAVSFGGYLVDGAGIGDAVSSDGTESSADETDSAGIADAVAGGYEIEAALADGCGIGDSADAFSWTDWLTENLARAVARYYCTITGAADGETDIEVPISSFQARKQTGATTYLSIVIPGIDYLDAISARANGEMVVEMAYLIDGVESIREEILRADIEQINYYQGTGSRSVTLIGHFSQTFVAKETRIYNPVYAQRADGDLSYRFAVPDLYVNPGDTVRVGDDAFTADAVLYMVSAGGGQTVMEVQE